MKRTARGTRHAARVLMPLIVFCAAIVAFVPHAVSAAACQGAPAGFTTECMDSCSGEYGLASNFVNIVPGFTSAICSGDHKCCVKLGGPLCNSEALAEKHQSGLCDIGTCSGGRIKSSRTSPLLTCPSGEVCCYSKEMLAEGGTCSTLGGVRSLCQTTTGSDQINLQGETYLSKYVTPGSCQQSCVVTKGNELCTSIAKAESISGTYVCAKQGDCVEGSPLANKVNGVGEVCPSGQICCIPKSGATAAAAVTGSGVTLPDPLAGLNFPMLIGNIIRTFAGIAGSIALLMFVWGGIGWITSGGIPEKVKKSRTTLMNAAIGLVLILFAYTFVSAIIDTLLAPSTTVTTEQGTEGPIPAGQ